jgi:hypothetical protein
MKHAKKAPATTLSAHLFEEAQKFLRYPQRVRRSAVGRATIEMFDGASQQFLEWRQTFAPPKHAKAMPFISEPVLLDELYSRELLRNVPDFVERTKALQAMVFPDPRNEAWFVYLKESANCYIFGLPQASVGLARAALESRLKEVCAKQFGSNAAEIAGLDVLINEYGPRMNLSAATLKKADWVRIAANRVLHGKPSTSAEALAVFEKVRELLVSLSGG